MQAIQPQLGGVLVELSGTTGLMRGVLRTTFLWKSGNLLSAIWFQSIIIGVNFSVAAEYTRLADLGKIEVHSSWDGGPLPRPCGGIQEGPHDTFTSGRKAEAEKVEHRQRGQNCPPPPTPTPGEVADSLHNRSPWRTAPVLAKRRLFTHHYDNELSLEEMSLIYLKQLNHYLIVF